MRRKNTLAAILVLAIVLATMAIPANAAWIPYRNPQIRRDAAITYIMSNHLHGLSHPAAPGFWTGVSFGPYSATWTAGDWTVTVPWDIGGPTVYSNTTVVYDDGAGTVLNWLGEVWKNDDVIVELEYSFVEPTPEPKPYVRQNFGRIVQDDPYMYINDPFDMNKNPAILFDTRGFFDDATRKDRMSYQILIFGPQGSMVYAGVRSYVHRQYDYVYLRLGGKRVPVGSGTYTVLLFVHQTGQMIEETLTR